jgi:Zn2+/Cd2+-exporting ATPase
LTTGKLTCLEIEAIHSSSFSTTDALRMAFSLERHAHHPIADAIVAKAMEHDLKPLELCEFKSIPGSGVQATLIQNGLSIPLFLGAEAFILPKLSPSAHSQWTSQKNKGTLHALLLAADALFLFHFSDEVRPEASSVIAHLKRKQFHPIMLTGDRQESARSVAEKVGIEEIYAHLKPEDKLQKVSVLSESGLVMIGDGVNDAPALARATVGISMGKIASATFA